MSFWKEKGMPHVLRSLFSSQRVRAGLTAIITTVAVSTAMLLPAKPVSAFSGAVIINASGYNGPVTFYTTNHSIGTCNGYTWPNPYFTLNGNSSTTCLGDSFGGLNLYAVTPSGYTFNGFSVTYADSGISTFSCGSNCQYIYFTGARSMTLSASFSPISYYSPAPAAPSAPSTPAGPGAFSVSATTTTSAVNLSWTQPSIPGGLRYYEVVKNSTVIARPTGRSFSDTGLSCSSSPASNYYIRAVDMNGKTSSTSTVNAKPNACVSATTTSSSTNTNNNTSGSSTGSSSSSSTTTKKNNTTTGSSSSNGSNTSAVAGTSTTSQTGTSSTSTENTTTNDQSDTLGETANNDNKSNEETAAKKKGIPAGIKILLGLLGIGLLIGIWRLLAMRNGGSGGNDYWTQPPQY